MQHYIMNFYVYYQPFFEIMIVSGGSHSILKDGNHLINYISPLDDIED